MEGLLSLLLFAGVFYLMMRFGCGAHMVHGHGGHGAGHGMKFTDPVCGMEVDPKQGYGKMYQGQEYRFCSRNCLDKFDADPASYLQKKGGES
jgi:YHS domain-containing protein